LSGVDYKIALVVPCFNEANRIDRLYWNSIFQRIDSTLWVFVDDGSSDNTLEILKSFSKECNVIVCSRPSNEGKSEAIRFGMNAILRTNPDINLIGYIDSDGAFTEIDIVNIRDISVREFADGVIRDAWLSSRIRLSGRKIERAPYRHYTGRVLTTLITLGWESAPYDTQSGFKVFSNSEYFRNSLHQKFMTRWFFDIEIIVRISRAKKSILAIWEEPLSSWKEVGGSHIRVSNFFTIFRDCIIARRQIQTLIKEKLGGNDGSN
jgi:glycosyltransferase involved in cell wall biosynthesis